VGDEEAPVPAPAVNLGFLPFDFIYCPPGGRPGSVPAKSSLSVGYHFEYSRPQRFCLVMDEIQNCALNLFLSRTAIIRTASCVTLDSGLVIGVEEN
jgi:hypothetical protein